MNKRHISSILSFYVISATVAIIGLIVFMNYKFSRQALLQQIEQSAINQSNSIIGSISRNVVGTQEITRNVSNQSLYYLKHNDLQLFIDQVTRSNPGVNALRITFTPEFAQNRFPKSFSSDNHQQTYLPETEYDIAGILVNFTRMPGGFWSDPYFADKEKKELAISFYYPLRMYPDSTIIGFTAGEIGMDHIQNMVNNIHIGERGTSFIINRHSGIFLSHPVKEWIMGRNLFQLSGKILPPNMAQLQTCMEKGERGSGFCHPEMFGGKKAWFYFAPMPYTDWTVITIIPTSQMFHDIRVFLLQIILVSAFGIVLIFVVVTFIFRQTLHPLVRITKAFEKFSFGDRKKTAAKNEIVSLSESLEELQARYAEYATEQNKSRSDRKKLEKDMKSAREIQFNIVPNTYPAFPDRNEFDLFAMLKPADSIGGDLYDHFFIDKNHLLIAIGDVSGKGIPASLFMAVAHTLIKANSNILSSKHIISILNKTLSQRNANQHFLTIFIGILDIENGIFDYCNAAHNYPYIIRAGGKIEHMDETHGLPVGLYANKPYKSNSIVLKPGDMILLYTDGVIDCRNEKDQTFGQQRLEDCLKDIQQQNCVHAVMKVESSLNNFKGTTQQADDISLMALKYLKNPKE